MNQKRYLIQELSELTGYSRRTIRYYIQEGLLEPPAGRGRGGFYYDSHLNTLSKIRQLQNQGLQLASIAQILKTSEMETLEKSGGREDELAWDCVVADETDLDKEIRHALDPSFAEETEAAEQTEDPRFKRSTREPASRLEGARDTSRQVWIRYPIADGVALHIRRDIDVSQRKKIDQVIRLADAIINTSAKGEHDHE